MRVCSSGFGRVKRFTYCETVIDLPEGPQLVPHELYQTEGGRGGVGIPSLLESITPEIPRITQTTIGMPTDADGEESRFIEDALRFPSNGNAYA